MRIKQLECIIYRRVGNNIEYLLLKRIPEKGEFWQPVTGGLEKSDKTEIEGAVREIEEETAIKKEDILDIKEKVHEFTMHSNYLTGEPEDPMHETVYGFEVKPDTKIDINKNIYPEHSEYIWVNFDKAIEMLKWPDNIDAFKKLNKLLEN